MGRTIEVDGYFGSDCPFCHTEITSRSTAETDEGSAWLVIRCNSCRAVWEEVYAPSHINVTREPDRLANNQIRKRGK